MLSRIHNLFKSSFAVRFVGTFLLLGIVLSRIGWKLWAADSAFYHVLWGVLFFVGFACAILLGGIAFAYPEHNDEPEDRPAQS
jgi:hypothetical protein